MEWRLIIEAVRVELRKWILNRYYIAVSKHFQFDKAGTLGVHASWIYSNRFDNTLNDPAIGANFKLGLPNTSLLNKIANGANLMVEIVPGYTDVKRI